MSTDIKETTDLPTIRGRRHVGEDAEHGLLFGALLFVPVIACVVLLGLVWGMVGVQERFGDWGVFLVGALAGGVLLWRESRWTIK